MFLLGTESTPPFHPPALVPWQAMSTYCKQTCSLVGSYLSGFHVEFQNWNSACLIGGIGRENRRNSLPSGKQHKAHVLARRPAKGPRKKHTRPKPRQYTIADLQRARDRVAAAERRIDNERSNIPNRGRAGLERAQCELSIIEVQLRVRGLLEL
jgi:hypothetical protein